MIHCIEVKNYRSLKYLRQNINNFQVLIGANASGKTTFLDAISFMSDIVRSGIDEAVTKRASNFQDLTFIGQGGDIELAIEVILPEDIRSKIYDPEFIYYRYEIKIGLDKQTGEHAILGESAFLLKKNPEKETGEFMGNSLFPVSRKIPDTILNKKYRDKHYRKILGKSNTGNDNFYDETKEKNGQGWPSFKFGIKKTSLGNLPADTSKFPAANWLKDFLADGIQLFMLDSLHIRKPSPPGQTRRFKPDGSNLPWVIDDLKKTPKQFKRWLEHIRTALPDIKDVAIIEKPEDKHKYIKIQYNNGGKIPSWLISDGTLRLLALTIIAYLPDFNGVYLIEEPENGIHPKAIETVCQSLSSVYDAQILMASHSPVVLGMVQPKDILCFAKTSEGVTDIINGSEHPKLKDWKGSVNLSDLFAGGILG